MPAKSVIGCYVRCSTEEQNEASQMRELQRYIVREGLDESRVEWFIDKASGDSLDRPELSRLDKLVNDGKVSRVIVWKVDRLSRKMLDGMQIMQAWLKAGVRFSCVTQDFDFRGDIGQMVGAMLLGFAQIEQSTRRERQRVGIAAIMADTMLRTQKYPGRQHGATKHGVDPARAVELKRKGLRFSEIATALGVSESTARRYATTA